MNIIVGLGNPENEYKNTRHNIGFEVLNYISTEHNIPFIKAKHRAHIGEGFIYNNKVMLVKPQTYMNRSGISVSEILNFYKLTNKDIIVIYDDTSLPVGQLRIKEKGSAGGHNGIKDIIEKLSTDEFLRIRIGIGEKPKNYDLADYVLGKFSKDEEKILQFAYENSEKSIKYILDGDIQKAMNTFNKKLEVI